MRLDYNIVLNIKIENMKNYLLSSGWKEVKCPHKNIIMFEGVEDDYNVPIRIILPKDDSFSDSNRRLIDAINLLTIVENVSLTEIIEKVIKC